MSERWIEWQEKVYSTRGADEASQGLESKKIKFLLNYVGSNKKILDLGCGDGAVCNALHKQGNDVVGVDLEKIVRIARKKYPHLKFVAFDLSQKFPFEDSKFDIIYASEILEHIPDDKLFLKECHRILVQGGVIIITVPNKFYVRDRIYMFFGKDWRDPIRDIDTHVHFYSFKTIKKLIKYIGFEIKKIEGLEYKQDKIFYPLEKILPKTFKSTIMIFASKR